ncbi:histone acetyltransferase type B catalytic subunit [Linepithema humile]|uniref:histone acetyltransferase type B catalytic subunit n=1 Tax=Linepithema humile TaxID=83485 RepID=UPI000623B8C9|nr:PREDICTED: histone acetyltransferase type B catalytic subunit [Linepithema humile]XP_012224332.1 PREDICTED: histone acetyltransferase type B catalytic subunit [Linepithema humile]XP_012224333.1 PREDICTED: histone acetyltransferase type B catalytic subunit [Linepithema humile]
MEDAITARLKKLVSNSNEALEFRLIRDLDDLNSKEAVFKPEMTYQVFGDREIIFGYGELNVQLFYSAGCLETYLGMTYKEKVNEKCDGVEADEVLTKIATKLAPNVHYSLSNFTNSLSKDETFIPYGELKHSFSVNDQGAKRQFVVYKADMNYKGFKEYHQRVQTFLLWYIDAALFIDLDDDQWQYFNLFEKYTTPMGTTRYATVGFATVYRYYAYPQHIRPRIAQFLILPPFRRMGLGTHLLQTIYREYIGREEVKDITVESPSEVFQRLRNYVDALNCSMLPSFEPENLRQGFSDKMIIEARDHLKINKKQARIVYEILRLRATNVANPEEYQAYRIDVKKRLNIPFKRKQNEELKIERALKNVNKGTYTKENGLPSDEQRKEILQQEYEFLEEEYKMVVKRLEYAVDL